MNVATSIIGLGTPHGDDRIGWVLADRLVPLAPADWDVRMARSPASLLDVEKTTRLVVLDACQGAGPPGSLMRWMWPDVPLETLRSAGSHDLTLPLVLSMAERLGTLPDRVEIFGIEVLACDPHQPLSPEIEAELPRLVARLCAALGL